MDPVSKTAVVLMDEEEAREKTDEIRWNLKEARYLLLEMYDREGWKALGYGSWREYGQAEFGFSESRIYQLADAARVEQNISTMVEKDHLILSERQLRPLTQLGTKQLQQAAWQRAVDTAPEGKVTARHVAAVVKEMVGHGEARQAPKQIEAPAPQGKYEYGTDMDPDFKIKFEEFSMALDEAAYNGWKTTSREAAEYCVEMINETMMKC